MFLFSCTTWQGKYCMIYVCWAGGEGGWSNFFASIMARWQRPTVPTWPGWESHYSWTSPGQMLASVPSLSVHLFFQQGLQVFLEQIGAENACPLSTSIIISYFAVSYCLCVCVRSVCVCLCVCFSFCYLLQPCSYSIAYADALRCFSFLIIIFLECLFFNNNILFCFCVVIQQLQIW